MTSRGAKHDFPSEVRRPGIQRGRGLQGLAAQVLALGLPSDGVKSSGDRQSRVNQIFISGMGAVRPLRQRGCSVRIDVSGWPGLTMRQITITAPQGSAADVAKIAFSVGISEASISERRLLDASGSETVKDLIELDVGTPVAKAFMDELTSAPFFDLERFSVAVRQPRSLICREKLSRLARPLVEPSVDLFEELWQFSQVTYGFVGRILIGALLLAYGLVGYRLLPMIAGLLFIPLLPLMLSVGFGLWTRQWRLAAQGVFSLVVAICLLVIGGVIVGVLTNPPVQYSDFSSPGTGFVISFAVGVAAGLATVDDVGRREMIGLAATAQIAIIPVWLGLCLLLGFPALDSTPPQRRVLALLFNIIAIVIAALCTYAAIRIKGAELDCFRMNSSQAKQARSES